MITVSNTSPVSNLAIIGRLPLLHVVYAEVLIPEGVVRELEALAHVPAQSAIQQAKQDGWLRTVAVTNHAMVQAVGEELDRGEAEAITLAVELGARLVMDELDGRAVARRMGIQVRGALWVLRKAREAGLVSSLHEEIGRLREDAHFWISASLEKELLESVGEA